MQNSLASQRGSVRTADFSSQSKLSKVLVGLIVFFSATQLGFHFWPLSSLVYGIRIDYLSPTIYFLDILIALFLVVKRSDLVGYKSNQKPTRSDLKVVIVAILPILLTNLVYSQNPLASLSWLLHLILYLSFVWSLGSNLKVVISIVLTLSLFFQTILASIQVYLGHSVGGLLYYIGERNVSVGSPGIALGTFMDAVVLRSYGTFSHPNVLAGYAVISLLVILIVNKKKFENLRIYDLRLLCPLLLTTLIVLLTQSRSAALSLFGFIIPFYLFNNLKDRLLYFVILLAPTIYFLTSGAPLRSDLSLSERLNLQGVSLQVIHQFPVFGTGAQSSITAYPNVSTQTRLLQPDHNSLTLFLSWFGLFGILATLGSLLPQFENWRIYDLKFLFPLLPLLLLDHYLLTSPQGLFIFLTYLTVAVNYSHAQENI